MVTIGDSFSIVAILAGIGITSWALILGFALLFTDRSSQARDTLTASPWKAFGLGLLISLTLGVISLALAGSPNPGVKLVGTTLLLVLLSIAALGAGGLCLLISNRIRLLEPNLSPYASLGRASAIVVVAMFSPLVGWFFLGPILLVVALGCGTQALFAKSSRLAGISNREGM